MNKAGNQKDPNASISVTKNNNTVDKKQRKSGTNYVRSNSSPSSHSASVQAVINKARSVIIEKDAKIQALQTEVRQLTNRLSSYHMSSSPKSHHNNNVSTRNSKKGKKFMTKLSPHKNIVRENSKNRLSIVQERSRMGRNVSISTANVLNALPSDPEDELCQFLVDVMKDPHNHLGYLKSEQFAYDLLKLAKKVKPILEEEPKCAFLQSPCYVFGDLHGNLEDLHFFSDNIWRLGMALTAGNFVFLGDYVDRGLSCLEVVAYLLSMKTLLPHKVTLLRGNHETRDVNGWEDHYGTRSFIYQCKERFGDELGLKVWEEINQVFDRLPLSAVIDQDIFCVHGGIPRTLPGKKNSSRNRIQDILNIPKISGINPPYEHELDVYQQVASDCIWSDPASEEQEMYGVDPQTGFGESLRGGGAVCFGDKAVTDFLNEQGYSYIMRAHEAHAEGVAVSKGARVFTVFSTSKDHNQGSEAMAGCILVDFNKMQVINRSPAYKNNYVHRRDSVRIANLPEDEIKLRVELGLITPSEEDEEDSSEEESYEEEEEYFDDSDEWMDCLDADAQMMVDPYFTSEEYADGDGGDENNHREENEHEPRLASNRNSSIDLASTIDPKYLLYLNDDNSGNNDKQNSTPMEEDDNNNHSQSLVTNRDMGYVSTSNRKLRVHVPDRLSVLTEKSAEDDTDGEDELATNTLTP